MESELVKEQSGIADVAMNTDCVPMSATEMSSNNVATLPSEEINGSVLSASTEDMDSKVLDDSEQTAEDKAVKTGRRVSFRKKAFLSTPEVVRHLLEFAYGFPAVTGHDAATAYLEYRGMIDAENAKAGKAERCPVPPSTDTALTLSSIEKTLKEYVVTVRSEMTSPEHIQVVKEYMLKKSRRSAANAKGAPKSSPESASPAGSASVSPNEKCYLSVWDITRVGCEAAEMKTPEGSLNIGYENAPLHGEELFGNIPLSSKFLYLYNSGFDGSIVHEMKPHYKFVKTPRSKRSRAEDITASPSDGNIVNNPSSETKPSTPSEKKSIVAFFGKAREGTAVGILDFQDSSESPSNASSSKSPKLLPPLKRAPCSLPEVHPKAWTYLTEYQSLLRNFLTQNCGFNISESTCKSTRSPSRLLAWFVQTPADLGLSISPLVYTLFRRYESLMASVDPSLTSNFPISAYFPNNQSDSSAEQNSVPIPDSVESLLVELAPLLGPLSSDPTLSTLIESIRESVRGVAAVSVDSSMVPASSLPEATGDSVSVDVTASSFSESTSGTSILPAVVDALVVKLAHGSVLPQPLLLPVLLHCVLPGDCMESLSISQKSALLQALLSRCGLLLARKARVPRPKLPRNAEQSPHFQGDSGTGDASKGVLHEFVNGLRAMEGVDVSVGPVYRWETHRRDILLLEKVDISTVLPSVFPASSTAAMIAAPLTDNEDEDPQEESNAQKESRKRGEFQSSKVLSTRNSAECKLFIDRLKALGKLLQHLSQQLESVAVSNVPLESKAELKEGEVLASTTSSFSEEFLRGLTELESRFQKSTQAHEALLLKQQQRQSELEQKLAEKMAEKQQLQQQQLERQKEKELEKEREKQKARRALGGNIAAFFKPATASSSPGTVNASSNNISNNNSLPTSTSTVAAAVAPTEAESAPTEEPRSVVPAVSSPAVTAESAEFRKRLLCAEDESFDPSLAFESYIASLAQRRHVRCREARRKRKRTLKQVYAQLLRDTANGTVGAAESSSSAAATGDISGEINSGNDAGGAIGGAEAALSELEQLEAVMKAGKPYVSQLGIRGKLLYFNVNVGNFVFSDERPPYLGSFHAKLARKRLAALRAALSAAENDEKDIWDPTTEQNAFSSSNGNASGAPNANPSASPLAGAKEKELNDEEKMLEKYKEFARTRAGRLSGRAPLRTDPTLFDYEFDSEAEWIESRELEEMGEVADLASDDSGAEDEEEMQFLRENYNENGVNKASLNKLDYNDGWLAADDFVEVDEDARAQAKRRRTVLVLSKPDDDDDDDDEAGNGVSGVANGSDDDDDDDDEEDDDDDDDSVVSAASDAERGILPSAANTNAHNQPKFNGISNFKDFQFGLSYDLVTLASSKSPQDTYYLAFKDLEGGKLVPLKRTNQSTHTKDTPMALVAPLTREECEQLRREKQQQWKKDGDKDKQEEDSFDENTHLPALVQLIHGSSAGLSKLVQSFREAHPQFSKKFVEKKILSISEKKRFPQPAISIASTASVTPPTTASTPLPEEGVSSAAASDKTVEVNPEEAAPTTTALPVQLPTPVILPPLSIFEAYYHAFVHDGETAKASDFLRARIICTPQVLRRANIMPNTLAIRLACRMTLFAADNWALLPPLVRASALHSAPHPKGITAARYAVDIVVSPSHISKVINSGSNVSNFESPSKPVPVSEEASHQLTELEAVVYTQDEFDELASILEAHVRSTGMPPSPETAPFRLPDVATFTYALSQRQKQQRQSGSSSLLLSALKQSPADSPVSLTAGSSATPKDQESGSKSAEKRGRPSASKAEAEDKTASTKSSGRRGRKPAASPSAVSNDEVKALDFQDSPSKKVKTEE